MNALFNVTGSLEMKHLCIRLALDCALATVLLMCVINFKLSSIYHSLQDRKLEYSAQYAYRDTRTKK